MDKLQLVDTTLHRKLVTKTYTFSYGDYKIACTHIFEYDEVGEYYFEDFLFDIPKEIDYDKIDEIEEEIKDFINNIE